MTLRKDRRSYRNDPRPRIAEVAQQYASMWSNYVQWDVQRRYAIAAGVDTASTDAYFEGQMTFLAEQLAEALKPALPAATNLPSGDRDTETRSTLDKG